MKLRSLIENPFRNYAVFSGRAVRAEFWLFVLTFIVITQLAWLLGFGAMKIAGFDRNHDGTSSYHMMSRPDLGPSEYDETSKDESAGARSDNVSPADGKTPIAPDQTDMPSGMSEEYHSDRHHSDRYHSDRYHSERRDGDMMNFMIHRHRHGQDGYHLHGIMRDDHMFDYDREDLEHDNDHGDNEHGDNEHGDNEHGDNDHGRYKYRGYHSDRHAYVSFHQNRAERGGDILWMISVAALLLPLLAVGARRLHDSNHSGWWQLLALIPVAGWLVLIIFFLLPGEEEDNRFGAPPPT